MSGDKVFTATTDSVVRVFNIDWDFVKQGVLKIFSKLPPIP
jgi:hypothetical protein